MSHYLKPKGNRIVVQQAPKEKFVGKSKLLAAAESFAQAPCYGTVLAKGPGVKDVTEGEMVIWSRYAGIEGPSVDVTESQVIIMTEDEVFCGFDKAAFDALVEAEVKKDAEARDSLAEMRRQSVILAP